MNSIKDIIDCLKNAKKAVICGHVMPDGDSIGSVLAMQMLLSGLGAESHIIANNPVPVMYSFLPGVNDIKNPAHFPQNCDTAVILDCTDLGRLGEEIKSKVENIKKIINIDHHVSNSVFGNINYVDTMAAATGEIVFDIIKMMGIEITREMAVSLYTAITMDTGGFMFDNTTAKSHRIAAELIDAGVNAGEINKTLFNSRDLVQLKLLGYALAQLKTTAKGKIAWTTIPLQVMHELGTLDEHADGIVNYPRTVRGVEIGILIREVEPRKFKVGFRSNRVVDVNKIAAVFGGGGHPRASGCMVEGALADVERKVLDACLESLETPQA